MGNPLLIYRKFQLWPRIPLSVKENGDNKRILFHTACPMQVSPSLPVISTDRISPG